MSSLKTGLVAASLVLAASLAYADSSVAVQGTPVLQQDIVVSSDVRSAFASAQRMPKTWPSKSWTQMKAGAPFTRDVTESMSGH